MSRTCASHVAHALIPAVLLGFVSVAGVGCAAADGNDDGVGVASEDLTKAKVVGTLAYGQQIELDFTDAEDGLEVPIDVKALDRIRIRVTRSGQAVTTCASTFSTTVRTGSLLT